MATLENLLWLRDTKMGELNELMTAVTKNMTDAERENFLQPLWNDILFMRHLRSDLNV